MKEVLLAKYARKLLQSRSIKAALEFAAIVDHDLRSWFFRYSLFSLNFLICSIIMTNFLEK